MPLEPIEQVKDVNIFFGEEYGLFESTALGISNPQSYSPRPGIPPPLWPWCQEVPCSLRSL